MEARQFRATDFTIEAAGRRLRARRLLAPSGKDSGPVLVFLHEGLGSIELWRDFPQELVKATGCDALIYDRWGHGLSERLDGKRPVNYLEEEAFRSLPQVLAQGGVDDAVLIGHSDGGSIALLFAARYGVRGVVTEAAHVFVEEVTLAGIREAVKVYESSELKAKLSRYHGDNTESLFRGWADTWLSPEFRNWNIEDYLPEITSPLLVIQGEEDEYGSEAQMEAIISQVSGPARSLLVPGCGHTPHHQARAVVLEEMARFIRSVKLYII